MFCDRLLGDEQVSLKDGCRDGGIIAGFIAGRQLEPRLWVDEGKRDGGEKQEQMSSVYR